VTVPAMPVRIAVVDIGTNSTRLLVADVAPDERLTELERRAKVTRLGDGLERTGVLDDAAMSRVFATLAEYREPIDAHGAQRAVGVLTSAVRDAANGADFTASVRDRYGIDARTIDGDEEARLTFLGATSERPPDDATPTVVIDIGGGSTELVGGIGRDVTSHVSTQLGVVRHTERHLATDPPTRPELDALAADVRATIERDVPAEIRTATRAAVAVAGTATSLGTMDLNLERHVGAEVHGHLVPLATCREILEYLASLTDAERRNVRGLHPDRAPTIVAGLVILVEALEAFGLDFIEVSDHDILRGAALAEVRRARAAGVTAQARHRAHDA
jgi:exopolyphosphatase / guanosine-5'-triphosphate,3'-diphosphate pyrophosphatase